MKIMLAKPKLALAVSISLGFVFTSALAVESAEYVRAEGDPSYAGEVLASAPLINGSGAMEIIRTSEDGIDGVAISFEAPIGMRIPAKRHAQGELPLAERARLRFHDLTGQELPAEAFDAINDLEIAKSAVSESESLSVDAEVVTSKAYSCVNKFAGTSWQQHYFHADCHAHGPISKSVAGVDDVCLLTAAIKGNHTMQLSYKAVNGKFYKNFEANVTQGHYRVVELFSAAKRTRKGQLFNATMSEYSRLEFFGQYGINLQHFPAVFDPNVTDCQWAAEIDG